MSLLSQIGDAFLRLIGLRKDPKPPPHADYWREWFGYFAHDKVLIRAEGQGFDSAISRVAAELTRGAREAGLPYTFETTAIAGAETILVRYDLSGKVAKGEDATTPPTEIIGIRPDMPWAVAHAVVYIRKGKTGDYLYRLILHEAFTHVGFATGNAAHSNDQKDVGNPSAKADKLSAADLATWIKAFGRRAKDGLEG